jgi:hypothetical protein
MQVGQPSQAAHWIECACDCPSPNRKTILNITTFSYTRHTSSETTHQTKPSFSQWIQTRMYTYRQRCWSTNTNRSAGSSCARDRACLRCTNAETTINLPARSPYTHLQTQNNNSSQMCAHTADVVGVQIQTGQPGQVAHWIERVCDSQAQNQQVYPHYTPTLTHHVKNQQEIRKQSQRAQANNNQKSKTRGAQSSFE